MAANSDIEQSDEHPDVMQVSTTQWSVVLAAGQRSTVESNLALERLCKSYWPPLYAYVRRRVADLHEAQDLTQAFFERMLERGYLKDADPLRCRFRSFVSNRVGRVWSSARRCELVATRQSSRSNRAAVLRAHRSGQRLGRLASVLTGRAPARCGSTRPRKSTQRRQCRQSTARCVPPPTAALFKRRQGAVCAWSCERKARK